MANAMNLAVGVEREYWTLDLRSKSAGLLSE